MSIFVCPNASRALLRAAARGFPSKAPQAQASISSRWLSRSARQPRPSGLLCCSAWQPSRPCGPAYSPDRRPFFSSPQKIVRSYEELPRDYRDQAGLAFSGRDLTEEEAGRIFGPETSAPAANQLLRILHGRRVAGTLEDPAFAIHTARFTAQQMATGLAYLRKTVPVDEVINASLRAEDELDQMERQAVQKRQREDGASEAAEPAAEPAAEHEAEPPAEVYKPDPMYGRSAFDEMRARSVARRKAEEKAREEERRAAEAKQGQAAAGAVAKAEGQTRAIANPRIAEYYKKAQSNLEAPPERKAWERILPSATLVVLVLGFMAAVCTVYEEPTAQYRLLREMPASQATVATIVALSALVLVGWRVPPLWSLFNRYMIVVVATVKPVTLFTAIFSHTKLSHLLFNMVPLLFVGPRLHDEVGRAGFLTLYLGCGALGFLGSLATYTLRGWLTVTSLGASGATLGLCSAYFWEHRADGFKVFGLPPDGVHGIVFLALLVAVQLASLGKTARLQLDIASHLSGMAAGILGIELIKGARGRTGEAGGGGQKEATEVDAGRRSQKGAAAS